MDFTGLGDGGIGTEVLTFVGDAYTMGVLHCSELFSVSVIWDCMSVPRIAGGFSSISLDSSASNNALLAS